VGEVADIAGPAVFLASDESSFIIGEQLVIDGGWGIYGFL
jgi:NAD(P)-dependent dehydrogenase (short-subunit alcohol dehydrogenase family)